MSTSVIDNGQPRNDCKFTFGVFMILILTTAVGCSSSSASDVRSDANLVYCLASQNEKPVIEAAVALGLAARGTNSNELTTQAGASQSLIEWREKQPADFERTCSALVASKSSSNLLASSAPSPSSISVLLVLIPAAFGAILAFLFGELKSRRDRRRDEARDLREKTAGFVRAIVEYSRAWTRPSVTARPSTEGFAQARLDLTLRAKKIAAMYPNWKFANDIVIGVETVAPNVLAQGWGSEPHERAERAQRLEKAATDIAAEVEVLAQGAEGGPVFRFRSRRRWQLTVSEWQGGQEA